MRDIYHYVLERLRLSPAACVSFEDSENGLRAALAAGLATVVTVNDHTRNHDFRGAALVLDTWASRGGRVGYWRARRQGRW